MSSEPRDLLQLISRRYSPTGSATGTPEDSIPARAVLIDFYRELARRAGPRLLSRARACFPLPTGTDLSDEELLRTLDAVAARHGLHPEG